MHCVQVRHLLTVRPIHASGEHEVGSTTVSLQLREAGSFPARSSCATSRWINSRVPFERARIAFQRAGLIAIWGHGAACSAAAAYFCSSQG